MAIEFYLKGTIKDSNNVVLGHRGGNGKPNSVCQIIDANNADEYISQRKNLDKKETALGWGLLVPTLGSTAYVCEKFKFGGQIGKVLATMATALTGTALAIKLPSMYKHSKIKKLNEKFDVQQTDSLELALNPDFEPIKKRNLQQ